MAPAMAWQVGAHALSGKSGSFVLEKQEGWDGAGLGVVGSVYCFCCYWAPSMILFFTLSAPLLPVLIHSHCPSPSPPFYTFNVSPLSLLALAFKEQCQEANTAQ